MRHRGNPYPIRYNLRTRDDFLDAVRDLTDWGAGRFKTDRKSREYLWYLVSVFNPAVLRVTLAIGQAPHPLDMADLLGRVGDLAEARLEFDDAEVVWRAVSRATREVG